MREIKFRAWHEKRSRMICCDAIDFSGGTIRKSDKINPDHLPGMFFP